MQRHHQNHQKRRQAIEPHIGHIKNEGKLGFYQLKGAVSDDIHAILVGVAYKYSPGPQLLEGYSYANFMGAGLDQN